MIFTFPRSLKNSANRFPHQEAFRCFSKGVSYAELEQKANQIAHLLIELGIKKGDRVGIFLNRCLETSIAIYGIMQAGAVYVPFNPFAPKQRTEFLIRDCGIKYFISGNSQKRALNSLLQEEAILNGVIGVDIELPGVKTYSWGDVEQFPKTTPPVKILESDLAYLLYTSGSTGTPKGIMHTHGSGLAYAKLSAECYQLSSKDRIGNHAPIYFDISTLGYFTSTFVGATTVIVPDAHTKLPASLAKLIAEEQLTLWYSVPLALIEMLEKGNVEALDFSNLNWILYGGEPFPIKHLNKLMKLWPHTKFCNVYGPTEVNQCTNYTIPEPPSKDTTIPLGTTWNNTEHLILDEAGKVIEDNQPGELLIRSATMMQGYWNSPGLNEKAFYYQEMVPGFQKVFYRTGDLVSQDEEGQIHFIGRKDRQVKIRGHRVELDEITAKILSFSSVHEAAVYLIDTTNNGKELEAAVISNSSVAIDLASLKLFLQEQLPAYAVPSNILLMNDFPRTSTGKINYNELKKKGNN